jgi:tetratricopeptide (TPR) repeat protein
MADLRKYFIRSCIATGLVLPPFLLGGVYSHIGTNLIIMGLISFFGIFCSIHFLIYGKKLNVSMIMLPLILIDLFVLLQLIPLPLQLLGILSPKATFFHSIEGSGYHPLTLSIPDSWYTFFRVGTMVIFASLLSRPLFSDLKKWRRIIINLIIAVSTVIIAISIVFRLLQFDTWLYGTLRHPGFLLDPIIINPNHAAGFFGISGILSLLLLTKKEHKRKKIFYGTLFFFHSLAVAGTLSRGGILAYILAIIFFLVISRHSIIRNKKNLVIFLLPLLLILSTVFYTGFALLEKEFDVEREGFFDKVGNFESVIDYSADFYITGSGAGSFSKVYTYYQKNPETRFVELENEPVQFFLEYGLFAFVIFAILIFIVLRQKKKDRRYKGYYAVIFFVVLQNTVDFNFHNFATLFPILIIMMLSTDHITFTGKKAKIFASVLLLLCISVFAVSISSAGHKLVGYEKETDYDKEVHLYPAHYLVPMKRTIDKINDPSATEAISATQTVSALIDKAPEYYFSYFLAGNLMLRIGSRQEALYFFRLSLKKCDNNLFEVFKKINSILKNNGMKNDIPSIIPENHEHLSDLEQFLVNESLSNKAFEPFLSERPDLFPVGAIKIFIRKKDLVTAKKMLTQNHSNTYDNKTKGELLMLSGKIDCDEKNYADAFRKYTKGASYTENFSHYLTAAYCALKLGEKEIVLAEKNLMKGSLHTSRNLSSYYLWKYRKELMGNDIARALKSLEKAAEISKNPNVKNQLVLFYYRNRMYPQAYDEIKEIIHYHPDYRKKDMQKLLEKIQQSITTKEYDTLKDSLLR